MLQGTGLGPVGGPAGRHHRHPDAGHPPARAAHPALGEPVRDAGVQCLERFGQAQGEAAGGQRRRTAPDVDQGDRMSARPVGVASGHPHRGPDGQGGGGVRAGERRRRDPVGSLRPESQAAGLDECQPPEGHGRGCGEAA
ncbi:hypothetical protein ACFFX0_22040 [Citricoccus parietis]|uniref:Uncharacterized protein n=1 Tax=Citricoccus parietis TaxID=592307 RepID=A0ABV5G475_9MICC